MKEVKAEDGAKSEKPAVAEGDVKAEKKEKSAEEK